jgi:MoaA/NifB/PqqE/SkfB family radical SAM enzyme
MSRKQSVFLFELTQKCEYNCKPCADTILVGNSQDEMRLWEWLVIVESIAEQEGRLIIAGGDPFLRQDLYDILSYAKVLGVDVEIATCGLNITPQRVAELKKNGVESVIIRLDGITREENDTFRGVRSYDEAVDAIKLLQENLMKVSLVINSDVDETKLDKAYAFSQAHKVPLFIATKPWRGAPSLIRSRKLEKFVSPSENEIQGAIIDPEGKIYQLRETGVQFSGDVKTKRYRVSGSEI